MPGIVGILTHLPREAAVRELTQMLKSIQHESFYTTDTLIDEELGVYAAWTARKQSFSECMPLRNEREDIVMVFSGEEFPEPDIVRQLKQKGHALDARGPSYLVHLYEDDPAFPQGLNGTFHGLVVDRVQRNVVLFNDRFGMHRLYYHQAARGFYFGAEAKAILAVCPEVRQPDLQGVGEFIACGCVMENRTLFAGVRVLPPASRWTFRNATLCQQATYFEPREWENQTTLNPDGFYEAVRDAVSNRLPRYFNGQADIGLALTGGLDTRVIMAWQQAPPGALRCYTFGSMYRDNQDVRVARQVSAACKQPHSVIPVGNDFLSRFPHYAQRSVYLTDGCVDLSRSADLYVSERARAFAPTKIVGTYGSEVLEHVTMFRPFTSMAGLISEDMRTATQRAVDTYAGLRSEHPVTFAAFRQSPWWHYGVLALEQTQLTVRSPFLDTAFVKAAYRAPHHEHETKDVRLRLVAEGNPALSRMPTDLGAVPHSDSRLARMRRQMLKLTFRAEHAYDYSMPQWLARVDHVLSPLHLERLILGRHKVSHFRVWYRDALARYVREMLLDSRTLSRPYWQRKGVEAVVHGHLTGSRNYTKEIHKVLTVELVHRAFFDQN